MTWFTAAEPLLPDIIDLNARWRPGHAAVICGESTTSWADFRRDVARMASAFDRLGLERGDHVVILMRNGFEMLQAMLGAIYGGFVAVPLNVSVSDSGIENLVADCDAAAIIASHEHVARIESFRGRLPGNAQRRLIALGDVPPEWLDMSELLASADAGHSPADVSPEEPCNVIYSSGTTGLPKGIVHSHACRMAWAYDMSVSLRYHSGARTLVSLGLFSNITWVAMLGTILCGGTLIIIPAGDAASCLDAIANYRITHAAMVPTQFQRMLERDDFASFDLSSVDALMCCGSPLNPQLKLRLLDEIPGDFIELYGLTEGLITIQDPADAREHPASVGKPCPGQDVVILDNDDRQARAGTAGEIAGYGRLMMSGYLNRDAASEEATWTDDRGRRWLRSGDIGKVDEHGNLYIVDRKKDMIISGGQNIYPADIESVMAAHVDVADVAIVGVASRKWGETPLAVVVAATASLDTGELMAWTNSKVGKQQRISGVRVVDELPRNPNGKVLKRELRKQFADLEF